MIAVGSLVHTMGVGVSFQRSMYRWTCLIRAEPDRRTASRLARQDTEPDSHHVQPGGTGRGEVKMNLGMGNQPRSNIWGLVSRRVVENNRQISLPIAPSQQGQKQQKVGFGVPARHAPTTVPEATSRAE